MMIQMTEKILVVRREKLFGEDDKRHFRGFLPATKENFIKLILDNYEFLPRMEIEYNFSYKQIIPYTVFTYKDKVFLYRRSEMINEPRLRGKYSIGIGGHIKIEDINKCKDPIIQGMKREFHEEISYPYKYDYEVVGFINNDSNSVGSVHFGVVLIIKGKHIQIFVKERNKIDGKLVKLNAVEKVLPLMEEWSQYVYKYMKGVFCE